jgi:hypothetical protein
MQRPLTLYIMNVVQQEMIFIAMRGAELSINNQIRAKDKIYFSNCLQQQIR